MLPIALLPPLLKLAGARNSEAPAKPPASPAGPRSAPPAADQFESGAARPTPFSAGSPPAATHVHSHSDARFDTRRYTLNAPPAGLTTAQINTQLNGAYPNGHTVRGVQPGSETERRVSYALFQVSRDSAPNRTLNVLVPDVDGRGNVGRVRITTDARGAATAECLGTGAPAAPTRFRDRAEAERRLISDFGIGSVTGTGGAQFSQEELEKVHGAFSRMSTAERAALHGIELRRTPSNGTRANPDRVGYFEWSAGSDRRGRAQRSEVLSLDDRVFAADQRSFSGTNRPASEETILHEAGHAVETHARRDALYQRAQAYEAYQDAVRTQRAAPRADRAAMQPEINRLRGEVTARQATVDAATAGTESTRLRDFHRYVRANRIDSPTDYGATGRADYYAETYMLYRSNPDALRAHDPKLFEYFDRGQHL